MKPLILAIFSFSLLALASSVDVNSACYVGSGKGNGKQKSVTIKYQSIYIQRLQLATMRSGNQAHHSLLGQMVS